MAEEESVFGESECELPPVTPVPTAHMLTNPTVPTPPDDIPDCADAAVDELPPDPPCPPLTVGTANIEIIPNEEEPYLIFTITRGPNCDYDFNLDIGVPDASCPTIEPYLTPTTKPVLFSATTAQMSFQFVKDPDDCSFDFDLDFDVPCPPITPVTTTNVAVNFSESPQLSYGFTKGPDCDYDLDIDIGVPCPPITPITLQTKTVNFGVGELTYQFTPSIGCAYEFEADITVPCPDIGPTTTSTTPVTFEDDPDFGELSYYFTPGVGCTYELTISNVKVPCPEMLPAWATPEEKQVDLDENDTPYGELRYGFEYDTGCIWTLNIELKTGCMPVLPLAETDFDTITWAEEGYGFQYHFEVAEGTCRKELKIDSIKLPCPPNPDITANATVGVDQDDYSVDITCDTDSDCKENWNFDFKFPKGGQGQQGHQGIDGTQGDQGYQGDVGAQGEPGDKFAIVAYRDHYVGLACTEMPEPRFEEIMTIVMTAETMTRADIDPTYLATVEADSVQAVGHTVEQPVRVGIKVVGDQVRVWTEDDYVGELIVRVRLSGIRRGHNWRFKRFNAQQARANTMFWDSWKTRGLLTSSF